MRRRDAEDRPLSPLWDWLVPALCGAAVLAVPTVMIVHALVAGGK